MKFDQQTVDFVLTGCLLARLRLVQLQLAKQAGIQCTNLVINSDWLWTFADEAKATASAVTSHSGCACRSMTTGLPTVRQIPGPISNWRSRPLAVGGES